MFEDVSPACRERTLKKLRWIGVRVHLGEIYAETGDERVWCAMNATDRFDSAPDIQAGTPQWVYLCWLQWKAWTEIDKACARAAACAWVEYWLDTHPAASREAA